MVVVDEKKQSSKIYGESSYVLAVFDEKMLSSIFEREASASAQSALRPVSARALQPDKPSMGKQGEAIFLLAYETDAKGLIILADLFADGRGGLAEDVVGVTPVPAGGQARGPSHGEAQTYSPKAAKQNKCCSATET